MNLQLSGPKYYTLTRGKLATFDINDMIELQGCEPKKILEKVRSMKIVGDFNDRSSVTFRTNAAITVKRLAFWGPASGNDTDFDVIVNFSQGSEPGIFPHGPETDVLIAILTAKVKASPNAKFYVEFSGIPVRIGFWTKIGFMLKGPKTRVCAGTKGFEKCPESQVEFDFHSSSNQMPEIHFRLT